MDHQAAIPKNAGEEAGALAAVEQHHAGMLKRLTALSSTLTRAVAAGNGVAEHEAHEVLVEWCETELLPHALAEEGPLYSRPRAMAAGKLLVDGMLAEHQAIVALVEELRGCRGIDAAVAAGALRHIFALHLEKENRLLLPLIASSPDLSLAQSVRGLPELVGETQVQHNVAERGGGV